MLNFFLFFPSFVLGCLPTTTPDDMEEITTTVLSTTVGTTVTTTTTVMTTTTTTDCSACPLIYSCTTPNPFPGYSTGCYNLAMVTGNPTKTVTPNAMGTCTFSVICPGPMGLNAQSNPTYYESVPDDWSNDLTPPTLIITCANNGVWTRIRAGVMRTVTQVACVY